MPTAEIIAIGTELLLGEIQDTNTRYLARKLRDAGIDLYRSMIVGDNPERIAQAIREGLTRCQIIITTGGLGPTVDDPTRQAVSLAIGVDTEFRPELWEQIQNRFQRFGRQATENNKRQAFIPRGALPIENPVGTAPAFVYEKPEQAIIALPGVPREMEYLTENRIMPYLKERFHLQGMIKAHVLHAAGVGESQVDEWIGDLEQLANPTVGLLAHPGQIDIRITAKANSEAEADSMIVPITDQIMARLGAHIFGHDSETLESIIRTKLAQRDWKITIIEDGLNGALRQALPDASSITFENTATPVGLQEFYDRLQTDVLLFASLTPGAEIQTLTVKLITPQHTSESVRTYGGPPAHGILWGTNTTLDYLRRRI